MDPEAKQLLAEPQAVHPLDPSKNPLLISIFDACDTMKTLVARGQLTAEVVRDAKAMLMLRLDKVGLGISVTQGYGLVVTKLPESQYGWSAPLPIKVDGFSIGAVMGYSQQHTVMALGSDEDVQSLSVSGKRRMKIGMDFGMSLGKQYDNMRSADTMDTVNMGKKDAEKTRVFTVSKGYLVDASFNGTSIEPDVDDLAMCYGPDVKPADVLTGKIKPPRESILVYHALHGILNGKAPATAPSV